MDDNKELERTKETEEFSVVDADKSYKSHRFKKKKRGIAGFFQKISTAFGEWWRGLKKSQRVWFSIGMSAIAVLLIGGIIGVSYFAPLLDYNYNKITSDPNDLGFENVIDEKIVNIALFGIDTRSTKSFKGNSDSMMILSINTESKKVKIVSIMRDSLVKIERNGKTNYQKINSAYAMGGPELAIKTLNRNFGLDIREYATVNFYGMAEIIDAVGGIEVELTYQEVSTSSKDGFNGLVERHCKKIGEDPKKHYIKTPGKHKLNGIQAVAYSRIRKFVNVWGTNNDFGRTDRQRYVMEQLFNKAIKLPKSKYLDLIKALIPYTETSLSYGEIYDLAVKVLLHSPTFEQTRMPLTEYQMKAPYIPRVGSTVYYDLDFAKNLLHDFFYEDISPKDFVEKNGIGKNDWYAQVAGGSGASSNPSDSSSVNSGSDTPSTPDTSSGDSSSTDSSSQDTSSDESGVTDSSQEQSSGGETGSDGSGSSSGEQGTDSSNASDSSSSNSSDSTASSSDPQAGTTSENSTHH